MQQKNCDLFKTKIGKKYTIAYILSCIIALQLLCYKSSNFRTIYIFFSFLPCSPFLISVCVQKFFAATMWWMVVGYWERGLVSVLKSFWNSKGRRYHSVIQDFHRSLPVNSLVLLKALLMMQTCFLSSAVYTFRKVGLCEFSIAYGLDAHFLKIQINYLSEILQHK